ncbi:MAG: Tex-like N-terminal domain-containing protein [Christensenellales bacterium]
MTTGKDFPTDMDINALLSNEFSTDAAIISRIVSLIDEGNTIPFIARYRKEMTGAMDDQKLREISERLDYLRGLDKRREQITVSISEQGKLNEEIERKLDAAATLSELEDIYRPYKPQTPHARDDCAGEGRRAAGKRHFCSAARG